MHLPPKTALLPSKSAAPVWSMMQINFEVDIKAKTIGPLDCPINPRQSLCLIRNTNSSNLDINVAFTLRAIRSLPRPKI